MLSISAFTQRELSNINHFAFPKCNRVSQLFVRPKFPCEFESEQPAILSGEACSKSLKSLLKTRTF